MIYFVTEQFLKENSPVTNNVDMNDILSLIKSAADSYLRSYIGTYFYNDLLTKFNAQTLNPDEITLVQNYIKQCIVWRATSDAVFTLSYQLKNKGIQTQSGDFSQSPDFKSISFMAHQYKDKAELYDSMLKSYLIKNKDLYPEFISDLNIDSVFKNSICKDSNVFNSGIFFI